MNRPQQTNPLKIGILFGGVVLCLVVVALVSAFHSYPQFHQRALDIRLWRAAMRNDSSAVNDILHQGANVNSRDEDGNPLLNDMLYFHYTDTARVVLRHKPDVNAVNPRISFTSLMFASRIGADDIVADLIDRGVDVNAQTDSGNTALFSAVAGKHPTTISYLLAHGADRDLRDLYGKTALMRVQRGLDQTPYPVRKAELAAIIKLLQ